MIEQGLSPYVRFGQGQVTRLKELAFADIGRTAPLVLEVTDGLQVGSATVIEASRFTIGDDFEDDVFLVDGEGQIVLSLKPTAIGTLVTIETQRSDVFVSGKKVTNLSDPFRLPCKLEIAETTIHLSKATEILDQKPAADRMPYLQLFGLLCIALLCAGVLITQSYKQPTLVARNANTATLPDLTQRAPVAAAQALLANGQFAERISFTKVNASTFTVTGTVAQTDAAAWQNTRQDLDTIFDGFTLMNDVHITPALLDIPAVSMVFQEPTPFVILMNGRKVLIGDVLKQGWVLTAIDDDTLSLSRNGDTTKISY